MPPFGLFGKCGVIAKEMSSNAVTRASPGDTIIVRAGTYTVSAPITINNKQGTSGAVIAIQGQGMPVIKASSYNDIPVFDGIISIDSSAYISISGIRLESSGWFGFKASNSNDIVFDGNQSSISLASATYVVDSNNVIVANNDVSRFCDQRENVRGSTCQEGISIVRTDGFNIHNNAVHDAPEGDGSKPGGGEGIDAKEGSRNGQIVYNAIYDLVQVGIYVDAWDKLTENIEVYGNRIYNTAHGIGVNSENGGTVNNVKIHDNLIYNVGYHGIILDGDGNVNGPRQNVHIYNNTIYRAGYTANKPPWCSLYGCNDWGNGIYINTTKISGISIHDNILANSASTQIYVLSGAEGNVSINKNLIYSQNGYTYDTLGNNPIQSDPQFVNAGANDFHLQSGSPAIGVGVGGDPLDRDADYVVRPSSPIDLGAFTYNGR